MIITRGQWEHSQYYKGSYKGMVIQGFEGKQKGEMSCHAAGACDVLRFCTLTWVALKLFSSHHDIHSYFLSGVFDMDLNFLNASIKSCFP